MNPLETLMSGMNKNGVSCQITKKNEQTGMLETVKESELKALSTKSALATTAKLIANLSKEEKLQWALETKDEGNALYQQQEYMKAMEKYVECLTASEFGSTKISSSLLEEEARKNNLEELVLPVLCNLAACCIQLQEWQKAILFCQQAQQLKPDTIKILYRQGISYVHVGEYQQAMKNFQSILTIIKSRKDKDLPDRGAHSMSKKVNTERRDENESPREERADENSNEEDDEDGELLPEGNELVESQPQLSIHFKNEENSAETSTSSSSSSSAPNYTQRSTINHLNEKEKKNLLIYMTKAKHGILKDKENYQKQKESLKKAFQSANPTPSQPPAPATPLNTNETKNKPIRSTKQILLYYTNELLKLVLYLFLYFLKFILNILKLVIKPKENEETRVNSVNGQEKKKK